VGDELVEHVDWPDVGGGTRAIGRDAVRRYWTRQFAEIDPRVEPRRFVARDDVLAVEVHQVVRDLAGAVVSDSTAVHADRFDGDLVAAMHVHPTVEAALPAP
jgi:predicted SnoaL-like aldol condensation-catalyzing enzyme